MQGFALEAFKMIFENPKFLKTFFLKYELATSPSFVETEKEKKEKVKMFHAVITAVGHYIETMFTWNSIANVTRVSNSKSKQYVFTLGKF
jgi:hypothetical protein